ncbi:methyltransferase domain-containing protein [Desulfobacterales bacterium HSG16]|nr:methyltransferase domain-containing protein [Desulfobacterales bacterium HSG16]
MITVDFNRIDMKSGQSGQPFRVLDIGCGSGRHTCEAARFANVFAVGADIDIKDLQTAKDRRTSLQQADEYRGRWEIAATDVTCLPFSDGFFDLVICSEVLEHIPDQHKAAAEIARVVKPGQNLVVSVPTYLPEKICWTLSKDYHNEPGGHIRIYRKKEIAQLIERQGFALGGTHYAHSLHAPYWWLKCLVGVKRENSLPVNLYHRLLVWDMMQKPIITRWVERMLNPVIGKSVVLYFKKT